MQPEVSIGISITNACYECQLLDSVCPECEDSRTAKDAEIAHQIVDEGNLIYPKVWFNTTEPSGHDWVGAVTRTKDGERNEFTEPITMLVDRLFNLEESITLAKYETICGSCHYVTNRNAICPNCN